MGKGKELKKEVQRRRRTGSFPSPSSSSSSDFEFIVSLSPSSRRSSSHLCPADELFYKGQLLPLHLSPRISMVRTLILASSSTSSSSTDATTTASRDSSSSSAAAECDSSRPSSVTEEDETQQRVVTASSSSAAAAKRSNYFSALANRFSVFLHRGGGSKKLDASGDLDFQQLHAPAPAPAPGKRSNSSAKQVIKKYVKKVKPLYEKLSSQKNQSQSQSQSQSQKKKYFSFSIRRERDITLSACNIVESMKKLEEEEEEVDDRGGSIRGMIPQQSYSFSGNLRYPRRKRCAGSCPSSMRSSPTHSGLLRMNGGGPGGLPEEFPGLVSSSSSSMEELQSAVQGAIAHCKSTMIQPSDVICVPLAFM